MHCVLYHGLYIYLFSSKTYWCRVSLYTFQVSRLCPEPPSFGLYLPISRLIKPNLPVITNLSNFLVSLPLSPIFSLFACFSVSLLIFLIEKPELSHPLTVMRFWIGFLFTSNRKFWRWNHFQNGVEKYTPRFIELVWRICILLYISGQWSKGSANQSFAFCSNLSVLR